MIFIKQFDEARPRRYRRGGRQGRQPGRADARRPPGAAGLRGRHRGLPGLRRRTPAGRKDRRARGAQRMIRLDTTMPRHRFEPSLAMRVSDSLRAEIAEAYAALGEDVPVAVRSSATAEDLPEASFAGQQDTYLNVRGLEDLLVAVRDCWASLWTARAMAYRARQGIDPATVSLAVVVQQMVDAEAAGVMFTANPSNGRRDETVISAAWGLGESVVSGSVNTDNIVVRTPDGTVLSSEIADKAVMTVYAEQRTQGASRCPPTSACARCSAKPRPPSWPRTEPASRTTSAHPRTSSGRERMEGSGFCRPGRSPRCPRSRRPCRRTGPCPSPPPCTSGPASSSNCPTRFPRCSPT